VLTRKPGSSVFINGTEIEIKILGIDGNKVRLGFIAPEGVQIHRDEVQARIDAGQPLKKAIADTKGVT
jgi:carbon storage regulator